MLDDVVLGLLWIGGAHYAHGGADAAMQGVLFIVLLFACVLAHEFGHAVTEHTAALVYRDQSGALNESMSDVFGALIKQYTLSQTAAADGQRLTFPVGGRGPIPEPQVIG